MAPQNMQIQPAHHQHQSGRKKKCCSGRRHRSPKKFLVFPVENIQCQLGSGAADKGRLVTGGLPRLTNQDWHWKSSKEAVELSPTVCIAQPQKVEEKIQQKVVQDEEDAETIHAGSAVLITLNKCEDESKDTWKADALSYCCKKNEATGSSPKQQKNAASRESVEVPTVVKPMWTAPQPPVKAKMILLGESGVGKTSLVYAYKYGSELLPCKPTIGAHYANFELQSTTTVQLQLWDTAGQERFRSMVPMYLRGVGVALLVYDITSRHSFDQLEHWIKELTRCSAMGQPDPLLLLVGNKLDRNGEREVHHEEGKAKASQLGAHFFELSAVDIAGVRRIFQSVADQLAERNCQQFDGAQEVDERTKLGEWETPMEEWQQQQQGSVLRLDRRLLGDLQEWTRLWKRVNAAAAGSSNCCSTQ